MGALTAPLLLLLLSPRLPLVMLLLLLLHRLLRQLLRVLLELLLLPTRRPMLLLRRLPILHMAMALITGV